MKPKISWQQDLIMFLLFVATYIVCMFVLVKSIMA